MALAGLDLGTDDRARTMGRANSGESSYLSAYENGIAQQYNRYVDEARQKGFTDPTEIDNYASSMNRQYWSDQSNTGHTWLGDHPWMGPIGLLAAGYGAAAYGAAGAAGSAGAGVGAEEVGMGLPLSGEAGAGVGIDSTTGLTTGAGAAPSSGGGGMFDDFTGDWSDGGVENGSNFEGGPGTPGANEYYNPGAGAPSGGLPNLPPGAGSLINKVIGGGKPSGPTKPGPGASGGNGGAVNGIVSGVAGALIGNNLTGGGGFASRNDAAAGSFDNEASLANQLWQMYQQNYGGPGGITTQAINDARNIDSPENQARVMGAAHADSAQATDSASRAAIERLRQYGVNPSSDRLASLNAQIQASGAAADAGSQTMARQHLVDTGIAARQQMAQLGNSLPGAAMTGLYSAGVGNSGLGAKTFDQADKIGQGIGSMIQPVAGGISDWLGNNDGVSGVAKKVGGGISDWLKGGGASGQDTITTGSNTAQPKYGFEPWLGGNDAPGGGYGGFQGGQVDFGNDATTSPGARGSYRRGGLVRGAGTGTSDSVPAVGANREPIRLSNGEYIIPADVVRHKGVEFFDRIVGKTHQPVGVRRA